MIELLRIFVAVGLGCASAIIGMQLLRGSYLSLVFKFDDSKNFEKQQQEHTAQLLGKLAATVTFAFFAADVCLLFFEIGRSLNVPPMSQIFSIGCDVAMIAFLVLTVRLFTKLGTTKDPKAKFKSSNVRISTYVLVLVILLTVLSLLF
ncbi:hypothetical protein ET524_00450 [Senegalimassilia faecalis]|uniref:DUF3784 domain-containing protein n=1 Tax=Senegalimassilia faecalis TaxID=2509433 RepID=A0A4V1QTP0_9ACTN|nr:hypothetical protein [Senegalimassilia faecalis]RXZ53137.1 hypothetical protein ET524_00450 [Senegalimassilia faecalis]